MCSISGFYHPFADYSAKEAEYQQILEHMTKTLHHRGPDDSGLLLSKRCGLAHTRLSIIDLKNGIQPMEHTVDGFSYQIAYNGEIYNLPVLKRELLRQGYTFRTTSDTEVLLLSFLEYGPDFVRRIDGIFSFAVYDSRHETVYLFRDPFGVKPLFYTFLDDTLIFSSEIKGLFCYPGVKARIDSNGLNEIFSLGPARSPGHAVFKDIEELKPGYYLSYNRYGIHYTNYWRLISRPHHDSYKETIERTRFLVTDAIKRQLVSDVPVCTFLSGGVDSSVVSAVCAGELKKQGIRLTTFSFDFLDNDKYFQSNSFQPSQDAPYVKKMVEFLGSDHHYLICSNETQADLLYESVDAHDLPCMADIDSSLLYFCKKVSKIHKVVLTGECADEVFGGYPWFHKEVFLKSNTFPWTPSLAPRKALLSAELLESLHMEEYVEKIYSRSVSEIAVLPKENETQANRRRIAYLNIRYFMQTLLNRMDRTSMHSGLEARVPFADKALVEYIFNVPWEMKAKDGVVKNVLREASKGLLPDEILFRKKSPYPKTYHPGYEALLSNRLKDVLSNTNEPLLQLVDKTKVLQFLDNPKDYGSPWYGQLMAGPQMTAYLLQISYWLKKYRVQIEL